jgi:ligand-binding SRPBCC domain-containing protein
MKVYTLHKKQKLKLNLQEAWDFFSTPKNLQKITPSEMNFQILSDLPKKMYTGLIIEYFVQPLLGIKMYWVTEIKHVDEQKFFVDEQRFGPYKFWHHKHIFTPVDDGILMEDIVHWALPLGFLGRFFGAGFVKNQLEKIFNYRYNVLEEMFNKSGSK